VQINKKNKGEETKREVREKDFQKQKEGAELKK